MTTQERSRAWGLVKNRKNLSSSSSLPRTSSKLEPIRFIIMAFCFPKMAIYPPKLPRECVCRSDVNEVFIIKLPVVLEIVHVAAELRGACPFHSQRDKRGQRRLIPGIIQGGHGLHFGSEPGLGYPVLDEDHWDLKQQQRTKRFRTFQV